MTHGSARQRLGGHAYERLEFLGDRVLALVISEVLMKRYPDEAEGALARRLAELVKMESCAEVAERLELTPLIRTSASEGGQSGPRSRNVRADVIEALIGALYSDLGLEPARDFILRAWDPNITAQARPPKDAKTQLQEWAQGRGLDLPRYEILRRDGPEHRPAFLVRVSLGAGLSAEGDGASKRAAEQSAAAALLNAQGIQP